jgi:hypothetical protein
MRRVIGLIITVGWALGWALGAVVYAQICYEERYNPQCDDCYIVGRHPCTTCVWVP